MPMETEKDEMEQMDIKTCEHKLMLQNLGSVNKADIGLSQHKQKRKQKITKQNKN